MINHSAASFTGASPLRMENSKSVRESTMSSVAWFRSRDPVQRPRQYLDKVSFVSTTGSNVYVEVEPGRGKGKEKEKAAEDTAEVRHGQIRSLPGNIHLCGISSALHLQPTHMQHFHIQHAKW